MIVCRIPEFSISIDVQISSVRKAYKKKALETHPDRIGPNASEIRRETALARFQKVFKRVGRESLDLSCEQVNEAFNILGDKQKRKARIHSAFQLSSFLSLYRNTMQLCQSPQLFDKLNRSE